MGVYTLVNSMSDIDGNSITWFNLWACVFSGTSTQLIDVFNHQGEHLSTIKYHDGFMGQRIGVITSLTFHNYKVKDFALEYFQVMFKSHMDL